MGLFLPSGFREINIRGNQKEKCHEQEQGDGRWEQLCELMQTCPATTSAACWSCEGNRFPGLGAVLQAWHGCGQEPATSSTRAGCNRRNVLKQQQQQQGSPRALPRTVPASSFLEHVSVVLQTAKEFREHCDVPVTYSFPFLKLPQAFFFELCSKLICVKNTWFAFVYAPAEVLVPGQGELCTGNQNWAGAVCGAATSTRPQKAKKRYFNSKAGSTAGIYPAGKGDVEDNVLHTGNQSWAGAVCGAATSTRPQKAKKSYFNSNMGSTAGIYPAGKGDVEDNVLQKREVLKNGVFVTIKDLAFCEQTETC
ncbi:hypothetical protein Anapl_16818 [Anas platyrhynchos]|uniref:Uncharacterized protein n=1 Tax=Anas platyrhynchos TaxID=8839 RepID=R0KY58_ANAPL|nr:hypothetical protein Anapl_16818 [Anas platyrhynchos]